MLGIADSLDLDNGIVEVEVALDAVEFAEGESLDNGEGMLDFALVFSFGFQLEFQGEQLWRGETPNIFVLFQVVYT